MMAEMYAKLDGKQEEMLARMREDIKSGQAEMRSTICALRSELEETIQQETKDFLYENE
jgi:signal transduction histidine kinase